MRVLLVEDDELLRALTARILRGLGHDVREEADGTAALQALRDGPAVDLVFTDMKLGGAIDGQELARQVLDADPHPRVVLTSGDPSTFRHSDMGPRLVTLAKPYRKDQIAGVLDALCRADDR